VALVRGVAVTVVDVVDMVAVRHRQMPTTFAVGVVVRSVLGAGHSY
jgi:hypothetical protein